MIPWELPFAHRLLIVASFLALTSTIELSVRGARATRWRDSLFLVAAGSLGALFGVFVDSITASISPDYFAIGKGLGYGSGLRLRALLLGARAGVSAGVLIGCTYLVARRGTAAPMAGWLWLPLAGAVVSAAAFGLAGATVLPLDLIGWYGERLDLAASRAFLTVAAAHWGLYGGGLFGTVLGVVAVRRRDRR